MQPSNSPVRTILFFVIFLGCVSSAVSIWDVVRTPATITLLTKPLEELEEHGHKTERGDSLQSTGHIEDVVSEIMVLEQDTWITGMELITNNAPQAVVHHIHLFNLDRKDPLCPALYEMLMDMGQDAVPVGDFPKPYGLFVPKGTRIMVNAALHNPDPPLGTGEDYHDVSVGFNLRIDRFGAFKGLKKLKLHITSLSDRGICNATTFTIPPYARSYTTSSVPRTTGNSSTLTIEKPGTIIAMGAHIHAWEGGEKLDVFLNENPLTTFIPKKVSSDPEVWRTLPYIQSVDLKQGDVLTSTATYSNPYDVPITGAMGMTAFFIHYDE